MNYLTQINSFYRQLSNNPLSSNAQCLYFYLLNKNNELGWIKEFTVANSIVSGYTSLSRQALDRARNELKTKGYIDYKKGSSNRAGQYLIVSFETQSDTQNDTQNDTQSDTQAGHKVSTLNKLNKTKQNKTIKKESIKKKEPAEVKNRYGEFVNVLLTEKEYDFLILEYGENVTLNMIEELSNYIESSGKRYKNHNATLRAWFNRKGVKKCMEIKNKHLYKNTELKV